MPKLRQGIEAVIEKLSKIATEWDKMNFYQFGFWLSRDVGRVRLVLEDEEDLFEPKLRNNTAEWFSRIYGAHGLLAHYQLLYLPRHSLFPRHCLHPLPAD